MNCGRAMREIRLSTLEEPTLLKILAFEQQSGLSISGVARCLRCARWFVRIRYSRLPLPFLETSY